MSLPRARPWRRFFANEDRAHGYSDGLAVAPQARTGPDGAFIPLTEQDRARWDHLLIRRGLDALARAEALGGDGPYVLQAALAACHARARRAADTDWPRIAALYDRLRVVAPSPVVDLNRAIAHSMAFGPEAGLRLVDEIADAAALRDYAPLPAARGDFLFRAGRLAEARSEFTGCGHADPQRAGKGLSPRTGGRLRRPALNPGSRRTGTPLRTALPESGSRRFSSGFVHGGVRARKEGREEVDGRGAGLPTLAQELYPASPSSTHRRGEGRTPF